MKKVLYIDMDNVLVDFQSGVDQLDEATRTIHAGRLDEVPGIFALMRPNPGAISAYRRLAAHFDTYILSTAPWENASAWSDKLQWIRQYLGDTAWKRLILTHHKNLNRGDYLVDDRPKNGAAEFSGEWIQFGQAPFADWTAVLAYLLPDAKEGN